MIEEKIKKKPVPNHVAVIMDGNGRWAKKRGMDRTKGHKEGMKRVIEIVESSVKIGVQSLTLFAFSTENWKRPKDEVSALMNLLVIFVQKELARLNKNNVKLIILGNIEKLPKISQQAVKKAINTTENNDGMILNIALNYGGQDEIVRASKLIAKDFKEGNISLDNLDEKAFYNYLYTKGQMEVDLVIRPSGELRISNFMLYQIAYAEFYFSNVLWPDFTEKEYFKAILDYQDRNRRFGGI